MTVDRLPLRLRFLLALLAGVCVGLSWQPINFWPLLALGLPAFTLAARGLRLRTAFGLGYLFGVALLVISIGWIHVLGMGVAAGLVAFMGLFFGLLGVGLALVTRLRWWPLAAACVWVLCEFVYSRFPFGGFGWSRLAYAVVDTPLAGFLPFIGVAGVSFLTALIGQLIAWAVLNRHRLRARPIHLIPALTAVAILIGGGVGLRHWQPEAIEGASGSVNVGIVQGNVPGRGIEALGRARSVTNNHLSETIALIAKSRLGAEAEPDFILWPENSTDIDPLQDSQTHTTVQVAAQLAQRPILVGAVMAGPGPDERQTSGLWWDPDRGVLARYDKRNLVPFGEWIPFRQQLLPLVPMLEMIGAQSIPGTKPGVLHVPLADGREIAVGDVICFELAYDQTIYEAVRGGAQVMMVQSNNATYGGTGQIEQQFAITRARAMETRREIAVATTNSVSGFIDRSGEVVLRTDEFTSASTVVTMPLRTAITPAMILAPWVDRALALAGGTFVLAGIFAGLKARRARREGEVWVDAGRWTATDDEVIRSDPEAKQKAKQASE